MLELTLNIMLLYIIALASIWFINGMLYWVVIYWKLMIRFKKGFSYYYKKNENKNNKTTKTTTA